MYVVSLAQVAVQLRSASYPRKVVGGFRRKRDNPWLRSSSVVSTHSVVDGADGDDSFRPFSVAVRKVQLIANIDAGNVVHLDSRVASINSISCLPRALAPSIVSPIAPIS